ncbi:hypothetical protein C8Q78DRAFT_1077495 [Trametes maxima]|nr:hypothetical protein C8Q78DRAFT_1077495 [Trametes maxima]
MSRFITTAFAFAVFFQAVFAIPPAQPTLGTPLAPTSDFTSYGAPLSELSSVEPNVEDANHLILNLCLSPGCDLEGGSSCKFGADMTSIASGFCFAAPFAFSSFILTQQFTTGALPFKIAVGTTNCTSEFQIPAVNQCFNVDDGVTLNSFARIG